MLRTDRVPVQKGFGLGFPGLRRRGRSIKVRILDGGHEVDSFEVSSLDALRSELKAIQPYLPRRAVLIQFQGVQEESLPLGINRIRREVDLGNLNAALSFLAA